MGVERDPGFRDNILRWNRHAMFAVGLLGVMIPSLYVIFQLFLGKQPAWQYGLHDASEIVVIWDKALILLLGVVCLVTFRAKFDPRWGRLLMALTIVAAAIATVSDDIARTDISFSPGYLVLLMLISIAVPFRAWQTLTLCLTITGLFFVAAVYLPGLTGWPPVVVEFDRFIFLLLATLACTGISTLLYRSRYQQYVARRRSEQLKAQVAVSEQKYRSLFDDSSDAILVIDNATGRFSMVNRMMVNLLGIPAEELYQMQFHQVVDPEDVEMVLRYHKARVMGEPAPLQYSFRVRSRLWDEPRVCDLKIYPSNEDDSVTVGAVRDITDQVRAQQKIRDYAAELETTNRELKETQAQLVQSAKLASLGNLVAGIAHEINSPLGVICSNAGVASRALKVMRASVDDILSSPDEEAMERFRRAHDTLEGINALTLNAAERIDTIVRALRNFARLDEAERKKVDIHEGIESSLTILPQESLNRINVIKEYGALPEITCYPNQLNQAFINLLMNAMEAIEGEGAITITTGLDGDRVMVRISDTGRGIATDQIDCVFDPGFTTKGVGVGTGLGLSSAYRIAENHKGSIDLSSELGKGTIVTLHLPIA
jgi:PAS domain S-box-containing protein